MYCHLTPLIWWNWSKMKYYKPSKYPNDNGNQYKQKLILWYWTTNYFLMGFILYAISFQWSKCFGYRGQQIIWKLTITDSRCWQSGTTVTWILISMIETCAFFWNFRENVNVLKNSVLKMSNSIFIDWKLTKY
jgi:hypothetical protein